MIYAIKDDYDIHSLHLSVDAATRYLEDLRKVMPQCDWGIEQLEVGRKEGHDEPVWGIEGVYDLLHKRVESVYRNWIWKSQLGLPAVPKKGSTVNSQFVVIWLTDMTEGEYRQMVQNHYKNVTINTEMTCV